MSALVASGVGSLSAEYKFSASLRNKGITRMNSEKRDREMK